MRLSTPHDVRALLERTRTIAVVGASPRPNRPSHRVFRALHGNARFAVTPIRPAVAEVAGVHAYPTLAAYAAAAGAPDLVDVFRAPEYAAAVTREAIAVGARAIWYQLGVASDAAIALADAAGLDIVVERCLMVDAALLGA